MTGSSLWLCTWSCFQWSSKSHTQTTQLRSRPSLFCHSSPVCITGGLWVTEHMLACQSEAMKLSPFTRRRVHTESQRWHQTRSCMYMFQGIYIRQTHILLPHSLSSGLGVWWFITATGFFVFFFKCPTWIHVILELQTILERAHLKPRKACQKLVNYLYLTVLYIYTIHIFVLVKAKKGHLFNST